LAYEILDAQHYITKSQSALNLQFANENVILKRDALDALDDAIFSLVKVFLIFSPISNKQKI
jgi:hypothetical protein